LQNFEDLTANVAQSQIATTPARAGQQASQSPHSGAVNECHVAKVQDDFSAIRQKRADAPAQAVRISTSDDAARATDNGDISDCACIQG